MTRDASICPDPNRIAVALLMMLALAAATCVDALEDDALAGIVSVHEAQDNTGLALVMLHEGDVVAERYLGQAVVAHDVAVTGKTRFQVMSITKAFVGAALVKSVSAGLVDLDLPIQRYLPDWPAPKRGEITLRRLAAHTAGMAHLSHPDRRAHYVEHYDTARAALATFRELPLRHEPGTDYAYSSAGYTLIAAVLEVVHDAPFPDVLGRLVTEPLGLQATELGNVLAVIPDLARNYTSVDTWTYAPVDPYQLVPTFDYSFNPGGGNLVTTAAELARFGDAFTGPGYFTAAELALFAAPIDPERSPWTFGWIHAEDADGRPILALSGATVGVQAGLVVYPAERVVLAALANAWGRGSAGGALVVEAPREAARQFVAGLGNPRPAR